MTKGCKKQQTPTGSRLDLLTRPVMSHSTLLHDFAEVGRTNGLLRPLQLAIAVQHKASFAPSGGGGGGDGGVGGGAGDAAGGDGDGFGHARPVSKLKVAHPKNLARTSVEGLLRRVLQRSGKTQSSLVISYNNHGKRQPLIQISNQG